MTGIFEMDIEKLERKKDVKGLIKALKSSDSYTRWRAAIALKNIGDKSVLPHLIELLSDENDYVRSRAIEAIGLLGCESAADCILRALRDESEHVRKTASELLVNINIPISELLELLKRGESPIRKTVAEILDKKGWMPETIEDKIYYYVAKEEWEKVLRFGKDAVDILVKLLKDKSDVLRFSAAEMLGEIGDLRAITHLKRLLNDKNKFIRLKAAESIAKMTESATYLVRMLDERDNQIRLRVIELIGKTKDPNAVEKLKPLLKDRNALIRKATVEALEKIGWVPKEGEDLLHYLIAKEEWGKIAAFSDAYKILMKFLDDEDENVRCNVVETLGKLRDPRCVDGLIRKLSDESRFVRWRAAEALGMIKDRRALKPLINALEDECEFVRWKAAEALGELKDPEAIEPLMRAMEDESEYVRWSAAESLWKIRVG